MPRSPVLAHALLALLALPSTGGPQEEGGALPRGLQDAIDRAIDQGVGFLLATQQRDGSWGDHSERFDGGQTALSLFALLKSGVRPDHPAIERGFLHLAGSEPEMAYSVSCQLLAYRALGDERERPRMERLLDRLLDWQVGGTFGYPQEPVGRGARAPVEKRDLSNTQLAALGMLAAAQAGIEVPRRAWESLLSGTLEHQLEPRTVRGRESAGFRYRLPRGVETGGRPGPQDGAGFETDATGSMTAAGIAILEIAREALGRGSDPAIERAVQRGLAWLEDEFAVDRNPGGGPWVEYYLYGIERVGALLGIERIGTHDWYFEGARELLRRQTRNGSWISKGPDSSTSFALLFLTRATAPLSGTSRLRQRVHTALGEVHLRVTGDDPLTLWVTGFDQAILEEHGALDVREATYFVDGEAVATLADEGNDERFPYRHTFAQPGAYSLSVRVRAVPVQANGDAPRPHLVLVSDEVRIEVPFVRQPWMLDLARATNLLEQVGVEARATSSDSGSEPAHAADGLERTAWLCVADDPAPTLTLVLGRAVKANRITLGQADTRPVDRGRASALVRARVTLDGKEEFELTFDPDPCVPAVLELKRPRGIRRIDVTLLERGPRGRRFEGAGFSEVLLEDLR